MKSRATNLRVCRFCVMDESEAGVVFDETGQCNCCRSAIERQAHEWWPGPEGVARTERLVGRLREEGKGRRYDAMVGLSGGIDSAFLVHHMATEYGLRLLAVHVDGGWNSEPAVRNIETLVRALDLDLHTEVIEWREMRDLQLAFLRAGVLNQDFPQDHAFFATLFRTARRLGIRTFLSGVNFSSESMSIPGSDAPPSIDGTHVAAIHRRFGTVPLRTYPVMRLGEYLWTTRVLGRPVIEKPLNFFNYDKEEAKHILDARYGWRDYGSKHSESRFTKFYQDIYLPRKHMIDKRRIQLSSLIVSGQMTRGEALDEIARRPVEEHQAMLDIRFVAKKLGIGADELERLIDSPPVPHSRYRSDRLLHSQLMRLRRWLRGEARREGIGA
jgi:N-acetyl sugar amidotransferase